MATHILSIDFETASTCDLRRVGAHNYARHPSTQVLCMAWAFDLDPVQVWVPGQPFPEAVRRHVMTGGAVRGWNVMFEYLIWNHVLAKRLAGFLTRLEIGQMRDTMAQAACAGLPLSLDMASTVIGKAIKDKAGHRLMLQMCRPRQIAADGTLRWWHEEDPQKYRDLCAYCGDDVLAERSVALALPDMTPDEQAVWVADAEMNLIGVGIDRDLIVKLRALADFAALKANDQLAALTSGHVKKVTQTANMLTYLTWCTPYPFDNLRKATVETRLADPLCVGTERTVLELRADTAKTSAAKLDAFLAAAITTEDGLRVCGMTQYYGAIRTGRWAGRLVQLQNLPRGTVKGRDLALVIKLILLGAEPEDLEALFGPLMGVVSSAIRSCIVAGPGRQLVVADFSQIEARVLAWMAGQLDLLDVFRRGEDPYLYEAGLQGSTDRQFGKVLVLALGYGMGWVRFIATAALYGVKLLDDVGQQAVWDWRGHNRQTCLFWYDTQKVAKAVIKHQTPIWTRVSASPIFFRWWRNHLLMRLPSGRLLFYRDAMVEQDTINPAYEQISFMGLNQYTRRWERIRTWGAKLVENATQAVSRDILAAVMRALSAKHWFSVLTVHDELLTEVDQPMAAQRLLDLLALMRSAVPWAAGLPLDAAGYVADRYRK